MTSNGHNQVSFKLQCVPCKACLVLQSGTSSVRVDFLVAAAILDDICSIVVEASPRHCCNSGRQQFHVLALCAEHAAGYTLCVGQVSRIQKGETIKQSVQSVYVFWAQCIKRRTSS